MFYKLSLLVIAFVITSTSLRADDTDIYLDTNSVSAGIPLIMLTLDYRPNLGSNICTDASAAACRTDLGDDLYLNLSLDGDSTPDYDGITMPAAWSGADVTLFDIMRTVFKVVLSSQTGKQLRVGMMINHDDTCSGAVTSGPDAEARECSNGAYILKGYFDPNDTAVVTSNCGGNVIMGVTGCSNLDDMIYKLSKMPVPGGGESHSFQGKELYLELLRYLTGGAIYNGHLGFDDFGSSSNNNLDNPANTDGNGDPTEAFAWDVTIENAAGTSYISPYSDASEDWTCSSNYAINTMFLVSNQEDDSDDEFAPSLNAGGLGLSGNFSFPDVIQQMERVDLADTGVGVDVSGNQNLTSYFIAAAVNNTTNGYATAGGTKTAFELDDPKQLLIDLDSIFGEILSESSIFVAASVPVSTFNRLEVADNVFFALFEANEQPLWNGNVKKLKIVTRTGADDSTYLQIEDVNGVQAFGADGRIKAEVLSHWTDASDDRLDGDDPDGEANNNTDGRLVTRGAAGQNIPGFLGDNPADANATAGARQVFTEADSGSTLMALDVSNAVADTLKADLGIVDADYANTAALRTAAKKMLRWFRGVDVLDEDGDNSTSDVRPWILGDPMHSRPIALNYGATGGGYDQDNPQINLIFGSNDGFLHVVQNTDSAGSESGKELLAFAPRESLGNIATLMGGATTPAHPYGVDGEPVALVIDNNADGTIDSTAGDKAIIYFGMRRGGKSYYAFDVSDPDAVPTLLWKIDNTTAGFTELAMTFSTPQLAVVQYADAPRAALVFGGGYHGGWNADSSARIGKDLDSSDDTTGNAVFIVNAKDGELIWKAKLGGSTGSHSNTEYHHSAMVDSIPSTVALHDSNNNDIDDRIYVGDSGGAVWRIDIPEGIDANQRADKWFISKLAELGTDGSDSDRRFFHAPKVVRTKDDTGTYDGVAIASGNRADPKETDVDNYFFMIQDRVLTSGSDAARPDSLTPITEGALTDITNCLTVDCAVGTSGWKLALEDNGEKGLSTAIIAAGQVFLTTFLPEGGENNGTCAASAGSGRLYIISLADGKPTQNFFGTVDNIVKQDRYQEVTTTGIPSGVVDINGKFVLTPKGEFIETGNETRLKVYWREEGIDQLK